MKTGVLVSLLVLLGVLVGALIWRLRSGNLNVGKDSYEPTLMLDVTEQRVLRHLIATFPDRFVLAKVPLANIIQVDRSADRKRARLRMEGLVAQFAVCGSEGLAQIIFEMETPAARKSVNFEKQLRRKYALLKNAGVPMVRVKSSDIPSPGEFRKQLDFAVQARTMQTFNKPAFNPDNVSMPMGVTTVMNGQNTPNSTSELPTKSGRGQDYVPSLEEAMDSSLLKGRTTLH